MVAGMHHRVLQKEDTARYVVLCILGFLYSTITLGEWLTKSIKWTLAKGTPLKYFWNLLRSKSVKPSGQVRLVKEVKLR